MDVQPQGDRYQRAGNAAYEFLLRPFVERFWRFHKPIVAAFERMWYHGKRLGYDGFWRVHKPIEEGFEHIVYHDQHK
jgi:hypothetical protein